MGQLIYAAVAAGARRIVIGLGGSGCTDGGRGLIEALGGLAQAAARLAGVELIAATDVEHPLLGPMGAARSSARRRAPIRRPWPFSRRRMTAWAAELNTLAGRDVGIEPGAGAAGGIGAALLALGGRREAGAAVIAEFTGLADDVAAADLIITGEGRFDDQSLHGKVVSALAGSAAGDTPVLVLAGQVALDADALGCRGHHRGPFARRLRRFGPGGHRRRCQPAHRVGPADRRPTRVGNSGRTRYR